MLPFVLLLPPSTAKGGYLPHWLLFISVVSVFNSLQNYLIKDLTLTRKVYSKAPRSEVTNLSARTFGTWTLLTSIVRFYGAYNLIGNSQMYNLCIWTFVVAGGHFVSEWLIFKNCKLDKGLAGPLIVASSSLVWMLNQREFYVGS
ncbi:Erg28-like protein [Metschnikowia bicuspidata var. bicuspidata NRRL YB-4993]|uniref:Erg28-like protein n=1 Tax=Metschnikowia bicuspidata var. bicuspidata NRRL YB-4993 TaxID=869754 RepID=A0A1A0H7L6_9ASCO|nr:Erg28-like protein [Metschnikowia bicuspidata var. bicuspidata NRRL YB-4993]OBA20089.1 Erg28-like protein [Metschnikowia bicuspidata var. bicuspidata NRRL YB-4993]